MCLWNGFMAAAPGHPFLAKVIEMVVNHVRNRYTVVEFSHMFCPNPLLSMIHKFDDLFMSGPCLLGSAVNQMLERDRQTHFEAGEQSHKNATVTLPGRTIILEDKKQDVSAKCSCCQVYLPCSKRSDRCNGGMSLLSSFP
jgi:hypothetical protein